jgi:hypothetical protein
MGASLTRITALRALFYACLPGYDALKILFASHHSGSHPPPAAQCRNAWFPHVENSEK